MGAQDMQLFAQSPRQWRHPEANAERVAVFADAWPASPVRQVVCHAPYLINLGTANPEATMGAVGLVVHIGRHLGLGPEPRLDAIVSGVRGGLDQSDCPLLLENTAGDGGTIGRSFAELARVIERGR